ncbi:hypothetical protein Tco_0870498, partial [Tanacetum coccineum]
SLYRQSFFQWVLFNLFNGDEAEKRGWGWVIEIDASDAQVEDAKVKVIKLMRMRSFYESIARMLPKLISGMNKLAQQTIVTSASVRKLLKTLPVKKMKQLGGKLGSSLQTDLGVNTDF